MLETLSGSFAAQWVSIVVVTALLIVAIAEIFWPDRPAARRRWPVNFGLGLLSSLLVRLAAAAAPVAAAQWAASRDFGLFHQVALPDWALILLGILLLDLALYAQHRALHRFAWGWVMHRLHHADRAMDVSTAVRFNPAEALVSMLYKAALAALLGLPVIAVLAFEAWLAVGSVIEHANLRLPPRADAAIRRFWVTPAMHRVHHSAHGDDLDHNYGFAIALWDRLFATYRAAPSGPNIGLPLRAGDG